MVWYYSKHLSHCLSIQHILPQFLVHSYIFNHTLLLSSLISPSPCVPVDHFMLKKQPLFCTKYSPFLFIPSTFHFPTTPATSIFPTSQSISPINIILFPFPNSIRHLFTYFRNFFISSFPFFALCIYSCMHTDPCIFHYCYLPNCSHYFIPLPSAFPHLPTKILH